MKKYNGNVTAVVRISYKVYGLPFEKGKKPTNDEAFEALTNEDFDDIMDEDMLEVLEVEKVG